MYMRNMHQNKSIDCPFSQKLRYATQRTKIRRISTGIYLTAMVELKTSHTSSNSINNTLHCTYKDAYFSVEQCKCCRQIVEYIVQPSDWHGDSREESSALCGHVTIYVLLRASNYDVKIFDTSSLSIGSMLSDSLYSLHDRFASKCAYPFTLYWYIIGLK